MECMGGEKWRPAKRLPALRLAASGISSSFLALFLFERVLHPCLESNLHLVLLHTECLEGSPCGYQTSIEAKSLSAMVEVLSFMVSQSERNIKSNPNPNDYNNTKIKKNFIVTR